MIVTKESFRDWKANPVTKAVFYEINEKIKLLKDVLAGQAGVDPLEDRKLVGAITAFNDLLNIEFEEVNKGD